MGDLVGTDMVRVPISAIGTVGDHHVRAKTLQNVHKLLHGGITRVDEGTGMVVGGVSHHAGIPPSANTAEKLATNTQVAQGFA